MKQFVAPILILIVCGRVLAIDYLSSPSIPSPLAVKSLLLSVIPHQNGLLAVGERGHIVSGRFEQPNWQQHKVPVSATLTDIAKLADGTVFVVGHAGSILKCPPNCTEWQLVFDGHKLITEKKYLLKERSVELKKRLQATEDPDLQEELMFQLEDIEFALEELEQEQLNQPNKPWLTIETTLQGHLITGGAYGSLLISENQGQDWQLIDHRIDNAEQFHINAIESNRAGELFMVGENGLAFKSSDAGQTWRTMSIPYQGSLFGIAVMEQQLLAFGLQGNAFTSIDGGQNWRKLDTGTRSTFLAGTFITQQRACLVGHGGVLALIDINKREVKLEKHPSGLSLTQVLPIQGQLILASQSGLMTVNP